MFSEQWFRLWADDEDAPSVGVDQFLFVDISGLWAVLNTAGVPCRGRYDGQDSAYWDAVVKLNVTGTLKVSRTFMPLLRSKKGIQRFAVCVL